MDKQILFVCDNRDVLNWGCRATSIALGQLFIKIGQIESISRKTASMNHPIGSKISLKFIKRFSKKKRNKRFIQLIYYILGGKNDYISNDPIKSVEIFLKAKKHDYELKNIYYKFLKSDIVVINGEGSLIFRNPPRRDLHFQLFTIELACTLNKPVYYINTMASVCPVTGSNNITEKAVYKTLKNCQSVVTRDPVSLELLNKLGLKNVSWLPDALFSWKIKYSNFMLNSTILENPQVFDSWPESNRFLTNWDNWQEKYICISGASRPPSIDTSSWVRIFKKIAIKLKEDLKCQIVFVDPSGDGFLKQIADELNEIYIEPSINILLGGYILANATAYISGRYHPSILASIGGTPCVFLESNSHKTYSLQKVLKYDNCIVFPIKEDENNINNIIQNTINKIEQGDLLRRNIETSVVKLGNEVNNNFHLSINKN